MAAPKGHKRYGGRKKGTPNKLTTDVRAAIAKIAQQNIGPAAAWLKSIEDPGERLRLFLSLLEFNVPKLARTDVVVEGDLNLTIADPTRRDSAQ